MKTCTTHHHACDCREAVFQKALVMLHVFRGCILTKTLPVAGSPCHTKIQDILRDAGYDETDKEL